MVLKQRHCHPSINFIVDFKEISHTCSTFFFIEFEEGFYRQKKVSSEQVTSTNFIIDCKNIFRICSKAFATESKHGVVDGKQSSSGKHLLLVQWLVYVTALRVYIKFLRKIS